MNGRSRRRLRSSQPNTGATTPTAIRLKKPPTRNAPIASAPPPWNGSRATRTTSTTVSTTNAGHCHAPRNRQRSRRHLTNSTIEDVKRKPPSNSLDATVEPRRRRRSRRPERRATWRSRAAHFDTRRERYRPMATETARSEALPPDVTEHLTTEDRAGLLRAMLMMRGIEERAMTLYRQGKVPGSFYDGFGQEAVSAGATWAMSAQDRLCILHRDLAAHIIRGVEPWRIFAQYMGRQDGITRGRDGNVHFGDRTKGCVGMVSMLPDMMLIATGLAMAFKLRNEQRCAITWFGDGSTSRGDFHEAMNWAGVQKLPVIFILENSQYAYSTPLVQQFAVNPS